MTGRAARIALAAALAAALPLRASAFGWGGSLGGMYTRLDADTGTYRTSSPRLDLDVSLRLNGSIGGPGTFDWHAEGAYLWSRAEVDGAQSYAADTARYRAEGALFNHIGSPLQLRASVSRTDQTQKLGVESGQVGDYVSDAFSVTADYLTPGRPRVVLGYFRSQSTSSLPGSADTQTNRDLYSVDVSHGAGPFTTALRYFGERGDGTFTADRYTQHEVGVDASVVLPAGYDLRLTDSYFLREPTATQGDTYSIELNRFEAYLRGGAFYGGLHEVRYTYLHSTTGAYGTEVDVMTQSLGYSADRRLNPEYFLRGSATVGLDDRRSGSESLRSTGETLGVSLWWHRSRKDADYTVSGGPEVGFVQPAGGDNSMSYGASAGAAAGLTRGVYALGATYNIAYRSTDPALGRWTLAQGLSASASRPIGTRSLSAQFQATGIRQHDPVTGDSATRTLFLSGTITGKGWNADVNATLTSATAAAIPSSRIPGDGFLVPAPFDQHGASVRASAGRNFGLALSGGAYFGLSTVRGPGLPGGMTTEVGGNLGYGFGALTISLEDRYVTSDVLGGGRSNYLMVVVRRAFGQGP